MSKIYLNWHYRHKLFQGQEAVCINASYATAMTVSCHAYIKLEAQWAQSVSLSFHSAYRGPTVSLPMFQLVLC
jgi:hypothetical protein